LAVCFAANVPAAIWGAVGVGKSSSVRQMAQSLGYQLFDIRLSDKEPSDLGGIPFPVDGRLKWLVPDTLPFRHIHGDIKAILFPDEFDRADIGVQNAALQLLLDRSINGYELSSNCVIVIAGNATTDIGTSPLSKAAANRVCHLYVDTRSEGAVAIYQRWAVQNGVSTALQGFAKFRQEVWCSGSLSDNLESMAIATPRSFDYADRLLQFMQAARFEVSDLRLPLVSGCVGKAAAVEFLAYVDMVDKAPTVDEVLLAPDDCRVPDDPAVLYAVTLHLVGCASSRERAEAFCRYGQRWPRESAAYLMKLLADKEPAVVTTPAYQAWVKNGG